MLKRKKMYPCTIKILILTVFNSIVGGNGIYHEMPTLHSCPSEHFSCCSVSYCPAALTLLRAGEQPKVCGWFNRMPLVCCHQSDQEPTNQKSQHVGPEPHYAPEQPLYIRRKASITEILQTDIEHPTAMAILPTIEFVSSGGYLHSIARSHPIGYSSFNGRRLPFAENILPNTRRSSLNQKIFPYNERTFSISKQKIPYLINLPFINIKFSSEREGATFEGYVSPREENLYPVGLEKLYLVNAPSSEESLYPTVKESNDRKSPFVGYIQSGEESLSSMADNTAFNDEDTLSAEYLPSREESLNPIAQEKISVSNSPSNDEKMPSTGGSPSKEVSVNPIGQEKLSLENSPSSEQTFYPIGQEKRAFGNSPFKEEVLNPVAKDKDYNDKDKPSKEDLSSRNESLYPIKQENITLGNLSSNEERLYPIEKGTTFNNNETSSLGDLSTSDEILNPTGEEKPSTGDLPIGDESFYVTEEEIPSTGDLPSSEESIYPAEEEITYVGMLPIIDESLYPTEEETFFNGEETLSAWNSSSGQEILSSLGEDTTFNNENISFAEDLRKKEKQLSIGGKEIPSGERRRTSIEEDLASAGVMISEPTEERKLLKISPPFRPSPPDCGNRAQDRSSTVPVGEIRPIDAGIIDRFRITVVGGTRTNDKWTWMAGIFNRNALTPFCGGTVIDGRHILTAAHCFNSKGLEPNQYVVKVGQIDLSEPNPSYEIEEIKIHENYQPKFYYNDIAIIRLKKYLPFETSPVCLPEEDNLNHGDNVTVLGWGRLSFGGRSSRALQQADGIPIVRNEDCNASYSRVSGNLFPDGIIDSMICAGLTDGGVDACSGDSGGPLLREFIQDRWALVGVISFGFRCAERGFPGVYTRVANYLPWISQNIEEFERSRTNVNVTPNPQ